MSRIPSDAAIRFWYSDFSGKRLTGVFGLYVSSGEQRNLVTFKRARFSAPRFCPWAWIAGDFARKKEHRCITTLANENEWRYVIVCAHKESPGECRTRCTFRVYSGRKKKVQAANFYQSGCRVCEPFTKDSCLMDGFDDYEPDYKYDSLQLLYMCCEETQ